jgi:micrococcal nuclease
VREAVVRRIFSAVIVLAVLGSGTCFAWTGKVVGVADGDTISVMHDGRAEKIRLYGVDAPEQDQDFATQAEKFTSDMVFGLIVDVQAVTVDRYGRTVAWVSVNGKSLNKELVKAGLAWWYRRYAWRDRELQMLQMQARKQKIGIWSVPNPTPPWRFRRQNDGSATGFDARRSWQK